MTLRRVKTYTAQTGYVYEYYFVGQREASGGVRGTEYIFDVISDRRARYSVTVVVHEDAPQGWARTHGRNLSAPEIYAAAKLRLQQGFDGIGDMLAQGRLLTVEPGNIEELLAPLGLV